MSTVAPSAVPQEASGGTADGSAAGATPNNTNHNDETTSVRSSHSSPNSVVSAPTTANPEQGTKEIGEVKGLKQAGNSKGAANNKQMSLGSIVMKGEFPNPTTSESVRSGHVSPTLSSSPSSGDEVNSKDKTPMCLVNELARFNNVQHQYRLVEEQGPPHKKTFTVVLKLGSHEEYTATGSSIKRARHSAAQMALQKTQLKHPTPKTVGKGSNGPLTPTVELNALAMKRGEPAVYRVVEIPRLPSTYLPSPLGYHRSPCPGPAGLYGAPHSTHPRYHAHFPPRLPPSYRAILDVGERKFIGEGNTEQAARHSAAEVALGTLRSLALPAAATRRTVVLSDDEEDEGKSAISVVYEMALKRNLQVDFEVVGESGPPHMRKYITRCQVGTIATTEGCGNGKKLSKKEAAEKMVAELRKLTPAPVQTATAVQHNGNRQGTQSAGGNTATEPVAPASVVEKKKVTQKKKSKNLIKEQKPDGTFYGQGINPISRLIQIQQAKKEKEPVYSVVVERGEPRSREFVIQCSLDSGGVVTQGIGPNKKTAKRKAAEAMLDQLGYAKPAAQQAGNVMNKEGRENVDTSNVNGTSSSARANHGRQIAPGLIVVSKANGKESRPDRLRGKGSHSEKQSSEELLDGGISSTGGQIAPQAQRSGYSEGRSAMTTSGSLSTSTNNNNNEGSLIKAKDQLSYLAQVLGIQVSFMNFPKGSEFLSLVALTSNPPQQCHGSGRTIEEAQDNAAHSILVTLAKLGIDSIQSNNNNSKNNMNDKKNNGGSNPTATTA